MRTIHGTTYVLVICTLPPLHPQTGVSDVVLLSCLGLLILFAHIPLVAPPSLVAFPQLDAQSPVKVLAALGCELVEYHLPSNAHAWTQTAHHIGHTY